MNTQSRLTPEEIAKQKAILINKIYAIGLIRFYLGSTIKNNQQNPNP